MIMWPKPLALRRLLVLLASAPCLAATVAEGQELTPHPESWRPIVYRDLVITGGQTQEQPTKGSSGDVRAWNVKTGKLAWTFHTIPHAGEPGFETWAPGSTAQRSGVNVWNMMTVDAKRVEVVPAPRVGYVWDKGHWRWDHGRYVWVAGHWQAERVGYHWVPGHWVAHGPNWRWVPGHWA